MKRHDDDVPSRIRVVRHARRSAAEKREKIFDLFENLGSDEIENTGVGLAIAKKLVTATGGRLWVESSASGGARFVFTISR